MEDIFNPIQLVKSGPILGSGNTQVDASVVDTPVVLFYFSAHWCPPCRGFTPVLAEWYKEQTANEKNFEIVFITSDRDDDSFKSYFSEMP